MPGSAAGSAEEWVGRTLDLDYLMDRRDGVLTAVGERFGDWLDTAGLDEDAGFTAWELHDHYIWNSARPRCRHGTLELRAPCQQPWDDHMCASALAVGLVSAHAELAEIVTAHLGDDAWDTMRAWHHAAIREGLAAPAPDGLAEALLAAVEAAVVARGRGEEVYLRPLRRRLEAGRNAAQEAADVWRSGGAEALVAHARVR
jgi:gamma-glutamylcysteine synthetase